MSMMTGIVEALTTKDVNTKFGTKPNLVFTSFVVSASTIPVIMLMLVLSC